jgi:hypothetical protein
MDQYCSLHWWDRDFSLAGGLAAKNAIGGQSGVI